eukprot:4397994-Amphidinium_carterae.1
MDDIRYSCTKVGWLLNIMWSGIFAQQELVLEVCWLHCWTHELRRLMILVDRGWRKWKDRLLLSEQAFVVQIRLAGIQLLCAPPLRELVSKSISRLEALGFKSPTHTQSRAHTHTHTTTRTQHLHSLLPSFVWSTLSLHTDSTY